MSESRSRPSGETYNPLPASRDLRIGQLEIRFNWFIALCVVMTCGMFINLGLWQLDRAADKRAREQAWEEMQSAPPIDYAELAENRTGGERPEDHERLLMRTGQPVRLLGEFVDPRVSFLVMYQFHQGRGGFEVVTPFRPEGRDELVLISRGWLPAAEDGGRPDVPMVRSGDTRSVLEIRARLHVPELPAARGRVTDDSWPLRVPRLHAGQAAELLGEAVYPQVLRLMEGQPGLLQVHWPEPEFGRRAHYGYAFQWFLFTVLVVLASVLLSSNLLSLLRGRPPGR
ncbi:MAG: SURF1 family protein [Pseudohongiellaceae bacterium]